MVKFVLGLAAAGLIAALAALAVIETGAFGVAASTPHGALLAWATHTTMIHAVAHDAADQTAPPGPTAAQVEAGFTLYDRDCVACHGGPGVARADWVAGMNPSPPFLLDAARHWSRGDLHWIVGNGVKMTGMPAWRESRDQAQIWDLVAFLQALPYVSPAAYAAMRRAQALATSRAAEAAAGRR